MSKNFTDKLHVYLIYFKNIQFKTVSESDQIVLLPNWILSVRALWNQMSSEKKEKKNQIRKNKIKCSEKKVNLLKISEVPGIPLLNFEVCPRVTLLNFDWGSWGPTFKFYGVPGPTSSTRYPKSLFYLHQWNHFKNDERCFLFILSFLKALHIFKFLPWPFLRVEKMAWLER